MQSRPTIPPSSRPRSLLMEETDILQAKHLASILSENCFLLPFPDSAYGSREISPAISRTFELPTDNDSSKVEESSFALSHAPQHASNSCFEPKSLINSSHDEPGNQGLRDSELLEGDISKLPFYGVIGDGRPFTSIQAMATAVYVDKLVTPDTNTLLTNTPLFSTGNSPIYRYRPQKRKASPLVWSQDVAHIWQLPGHGQRDSREAEPGNSNNVGSTNLRPGPGSCT